MDADQKRFLADREIADGAMLGAKARNYTTGWKIRILRMLWAMLDRGLGHQFVLLFVDLLACLVGMFCGWTMGNPIWGIGDPLAKYFPSIAVICLGIVGSSYTLHGYKPVFLRRQERELEIIVKSATSALLLIFALNFLVFKTAEFSRYIYLFSFGFVLALLVMGRFGIRRLYRTFWHHKIGRERALIVGHGPECAERLREQFRIQQFSRFELVGYVEKKNGRLLYSGTEQEVTISGNLERLFDEQEISTIFVALDDYSKESREVFLDLVAACEKTNRQVFVLSNTFMSDHYIRDMDQYVGLMGMRWKKPELEKRAPLFTKRLLDIVGSLCLGIVLSPLIIAIAIAIKIQDRGSVFHRRRVVGRHGTVFDALKFRTMVEDADALLAINPELKANLEKNFKLRDDPRVTPIGKILRKLSLDELPQLYNAFLGQMSLVGPRMVTPEEIERYGEFKTERIKIRPAVTGYWQVNGRQDVSYGERIQMDRF
jgi:exopolysaccharide biosynthesis polyprenyl glycosylphosphotransferase